MIPLAKPDLSGNELKYLTECITTGYVTHHGRFEREFEDAFSRKFGTPCIATSSGTGALHLALLSLGIGHGDEVLVPALTFGATASAVLAVGAKPVLVDVESDAPCLDRKKVLSLLNRKTRAIIPVALYGCDPGDFRQFGIKVVEDNCEALGTAPIQGHLTAYSFYGNKMLTTGEGGMLCGELGNAKEWRDGGFDESYRNTIPGINYRMSNLSAAVGLAQLERFDTLLSDRQRNIRMFSERLKGLGKWMYVVDCDDPRGLQQHLRESGVDSRPVFTPLHRSPAFRMYAKGNYRQSDRFWERGLCLPSGPHVTPNDVDRIVELVLGYIRGQRTIKNGTLKLHDAASGDQVSTPSL